MANNEAVFGIYSNRAKVETALNELRDAGFINTDISLLAAEKTASDLGFKKTTKAPEGATTGGLTGGIIGGVLGWLAGVGLLSIPGIGPFIAAGPIMALLAGAGTGGTIGGIAGALTGIGMPEYEAKRYENRIALGEILLSVHTKDSISKDRAEDILKRTGGMDVGTEKEIREKVGISK